MSTKPAYLPVIVVGLLTTAPSCIALDGCGSLSLDEAAGGGAAASGSTGAVPTSVSGGDQGGNGPSSSGSVGNGGEAPDTSTGVGGAPGAGGAGGGCERYDVCGNPVDEDCDGDEAACPAGDWWTWVEGAAEDSFATSVSVDEDGNAFVAGALDSTHYFVAKYDPDGAQLWLRPLELTEGDASTQERALFVGARRGTVFVAGTAIGELYLDLDPDPIGIPAQTHGFVATLDEENGDIVEKLLIGPPGSLVTAVDAATLVETTTSAHFLVTGTNAATISLGADTINGKNAYLANISADLDVLDARQLFDALLTNGGVRPTAIAATGDEVVVALSFTGQVDPLGNDGPVTSTNHLSTFTQQFALEGDSQTLAQGTLHALLDSQNGAPTTVPALALDEDGRLHLALSTADAQNLTFDYLPAGALQGAGWVYLRIDEAQTLQDVESLGSGIAAVGSIVPADGGDAIVMGGYAADGALLLDSTPVAGPFLAELGTANVESLSLVWSIAAQTDDGAETMTATLDPASLDRSIRVVGTLQGEALIHTESDGGSQLFPVAFAARFSR